MKSIRPKVIPKSKSMDVAELGFKVTKTAPAPKPVFLQMLLTTSPVMIYILYALHAVADFCLLCYLVLLPTSQFWAATLHFSALQVLRSASTIAEMF